MSVLIIAEAGVNHNGDLGLAKRLVDAAKAAGADLVKFQTFRADRLVTKDAKKADYQVAAEGGGESQWEMLKRLEMDDAMHQELIAYCGAVGIEFFSTGFDEESLGYLAELGLKRIKVPSGEITNLPYLRKVAASGGEVILSTGMATLDEVRDALEVLEASGCPRKKITVLHCNTEYPTPMADVNLRAMGAMGDEFGVCVGYSDHTQGIEVAVAAVALGAQVIEKHLTLDRNLSGPDHRASLEPGEFAAMVRAIRNIETALGDGRKSPSPSESKNRAVARKSLVAAVPIRCGERFSPENVAVKRPGTGMSPMRWDEVMGKVAGRDFAQDELIAI